MAEYVNAGDYGGAALSLFGQLHVLISQEATYAPSAGGVVALSIVPIVVLLVVLVAIFSAMDSIPLQRLVCPLRSHGGPAGGVPAHPLVAPARQRLVPPPEKSPAPQRSQTAPRPRWFRRRTSSSHGRRTPTAQKRQLRRRPGRQLRRKPGREFWRRPGRKLWRRNAAAASVGAGEEALEAAAAEASVEVAEAAALAAGAELHIFERTSGIPCGVPGGYADCTIFG